MTQPDYKITTLLMRVLGWALVPSLLTLIFIYPHGFLWGIEEQSSWHPYLWMMISLYVSWCYQLIRAADKPADAAHLFDFGIISSILHASVMVIQTMMMWQHEMPHMWADIPLLLVIALLLHLYHPNRIHKFANK